jgi:hypothetical protein
MKFVTSFERIGIKKGKQEGALLTLQKSIPFMLEIKFNVVDNSIIERLRIEDLIKSKIKKCVGWVEE